MIIGCPRKSDTQHARYDYDEYGNPLSTFTRASGLVTDTPAARIASRQMLRYAGYAFDSESGMYYCSARTYDPYTMQFLQKDPAKADGEGSAYQYCGGDPVGKTDPSGMWWTYERLRFRRKAAIKYSFMWAAPGQVWQVLGPLFAEAMGARIGPTVDVAGQALLNSLKPGGATNLPVYAGEGDLWKFQADDYARRTSSTRNSGYERKYSIALRILCYQSGRFLQKATATQSFWTTYKERGPGGYMRYPTRIRIRPDDYREPKDRWIDRVNGEVFR